MTMVMSGPGSRRERKKTAIRNQIISASVELFSRHGISEVIVLIRHVPPENPEIRLPAEWMRKPVAGAPNNWVQIQKTKDGKYLAAVGKETFDGEIKLSLVDGKIVSASIDNPVETMERECAGVALTECGARKPHMICSESQCHWNLDWRKII
jgi:hypothetical protein